MASLSRDEGGTTETLGEREAFSRGGDKAVFGRSAFLATERKRTAIRAAIGRDVGVGRAAGKALDDRNWTIYGRRCR